MGLLADFKTATGESGGEQYYIDYYIRPALDRATVLATNIKKTVVTLTSGTQSYDLTSSVADPVVGSSGVQDIIFDGENVTGLVYKRDWYIQGLTTLYFVDSTDTYSGTFTFKYNGFFSKPTTGDDTTDCPAVLQPAVLKYATALYGLDKIGVGDYNKGVVRKREENLDVDYGDVTGRGEELRNQLELAENLMRQQGAVSALNFASIQVI